ncbi:MAG: diphosphomevalonate/mevalonate 3,5-bisphosphate decarboxylase family protein [Bdellovibrionales bacterium]
MGLDAWRAQAPANIALIKYMGKTDLFENQPSNASLSYSLDHLISAVEIWPSESGQDSWQPLRADDFEIPQLSSQGQERFLKHFDFLKSQLQIPGHYKILSANNFPSDCGLASSASSFAALTKAAHQLALDRSLDREASESLSTQELSQLSRRGSGSSCRSLFSPWALWRGPGAENLNLPWPYLHHQVVVLEKSKKAVSSSDAHKRVSSSELFQGRAARAEKRLHQLLAALNQKQWRQSCELVWADFWDMHALFETSQPAFGYMTSGSMAVLESVREIWKKEDDGPMVTMDAGANVHLLYRADQILTAHRMSRALSSLGQVIESPSLYLEGR